VGVHRPVLGTLVAWVALNSVVLARYAAAFDPYLFGPGVWCDGSSLNRSGSLVQARQMNS
jgi:hypothetical protein